jgi:hypothetical protein
MKGWHDGKMLGESVGVNENSEEGDGHQFCVLAGCNIVGGRRLCHSF